MSSTAGKRPCDSPLDPTWPGPLRDERALAAGKFGDQRISMQIPAEVGADVDGGIIAKVLWIGLVPLSAAPDSGG